MNFLPVCLDITDKNILFIGGGKVCLHKLKTVILYTYNIRVLAPEISDEISAYEVELVRDFYRVEYLEGASIVYACTNNRELNLRIKDDCKKMNILVNVCDDPENCDFISPAIYKDGNISVAVSSDGKDVKKSVSLRNSIREILEGFKGKH